MCVQRIDTAQSQSKRNIRDGGATCRLERDDDDGRG